MPRLKSLIVPREFLQSHPVASYFVLTFALSWTGALAVAAPKLMGGHPIPKTFGLLMFPAMLVGPALVGIGLTRIVDGRIGVRELFSRMRRVSLRARWYLALLIPPVLVFITLLGLKTFLSPAYNPNRFLLGISFGLAAAFFEEIGWMGFAFPKMCQSRGPLAASVLLGVLWGAWHLPVVDYLGAATPHGAFWLRFFLAFLSAMTAMRVLIAFLYANTNSVLLTQLMHASSTGALVVFSPPAVSAEQEVVWYAVYAAALWMVVAMLTITCRLANLRTSSD